MRRRGPPSTPRYSIRAGVSAVAAARLRSHASRIARASSIARARCRERSRPVTADRRARDSRQRSVHQDDCRFDQRVRPRAPSRVGACAATHVSADATTSTVAPYGLAGSVAARTPLSLAPCLSAIEDDRPRVGARTASRQDPLRIAAPQASASSIAVRTGYTVEIRPGQVLDRQRFARH